MAQPPQVKRSKYRQADDPFVSDTEEQFRQAERIGKPMEVHEYLARRPRVKTPIYYNSDALHRNITLYYVLQKNARRAPAKGCAPAFSLRMTRGKPATGPRHAANVKDTVDLIVQCREGQGKMVAVPITITGNDSADHSNMLFFNLVLQTAEHYEPHGMLNTDVIDEVRGLLVDVNAALRKAKQPEFTVVIGADACPRVKVNPATLTVSVHRTAQLQQLPPQLIDGPYLGEQTYEIRLKETMKDSKYGVTFRDPGGFCMAFSFMMMDLRLKYLHVPLADLRLAWMEQPGDITEFLRGFARFQLDVLASMVRDILGPAWDKRGIRLKAFRDLTEAKAQQARIYFFVRQLIMFKLRALFDPVQAEEWTRELLKTTHSFYN